MEAGSPGGGGAPAPPTPPCPDAGNANANVNTNVLQHIVNRQVGRQLNNRQVLLQQHASFVRRLELRDRLEMHDGCVNTIAWNEGGDLLVSGSDDTCLGIWRYPGVRGLAEGAASSGASSGGGGGGQSQPAARIATGHRENIFAAHFVPHTGDAQLVSAAADGEIRLHDTSASSSASSRLLHTADNFILKMVCACRRLFRHPAWRSCPGCARA